MKRKFQFYCNDVWHFQKFCFSSPHHGRPVHHSSPHHASPVHISSPHYSPPVHNSSPQRSPQHHSFQGRFQNPHSSGKVIIHKFCGGVSLEPICCKKQQKSSNQETGFGNRGYMMGVTHAHLRFKIRAFGIPFSPNQFLGYDSFFAASNSKTALISWFTSLKSTKRLKNCHQTRS